MKKFLTIMLSALLVLSLAACSKKAEETSAAVAESSESAAETVSETQGTTDVDKINEIVDGLDMTLPKELGSVAKLADYKGIELSVNEPEKITDDTAMEYIESYILPNFTEEADVIENGDIANIDYTGKKDGVAFDGGTAEGYDLEIGSGSFIDGFESGLIGVKKGETVDLNLKFPENYGNADLAGKEVVFTVKVNSISRQCELTDELAPQIDEKYKTAADVVRDTVESLQKEANLSAKQELYYAAVSKVLEGSEVNVSDDAVRYTTNNYVKNYAASAQLYGIDLGTLLSYYGSSYEEFVDSYHEYSVESVKQRAVLEEIAKLENLTVADEDKEAFAEEYGYTLDSILEAVDAQLFEELVREDKANRFIVDNAVVTYIKSEG